jgi:hypothetical protein
MDRTRKAGSISMPHLSLEQGVLPTELGPLASPSADRRRRVPLRSI